MTEMELMEMKIDIESQIESLNRKCALYGYEKPMLHVVDGTNSEEVQDQEEDSIENTDSEDVKEEATDVTGYVETRQMRKAFKERGCNYLDDGEFVRWMFKACGSSVFGTLHPDGETDEYSKFADKVWGNEVICDHFDWFDNIIDRMVNLVNNIYQVYLFSTHR